MSEKFLEKQGQKQENAQAGQKLRENDRLTDEELEQIVGGGGSSEQKQVKELTPILPEKEWTSSMDILK